MERRKSVILADRLNAAEIGLDIKIGPILKEGKTPKINLKESLDGKTRDKTTSNENYALKTPRYLFKSSQIALILNHLSFFL